MHTATTGAPPRGLNGGGHVPPPVLAPSPPMSTCRRLSYDSVVSGRCSRSRTRGSSSVSSPARSHSRSTPPPAQQPTPPPAQQQRHFWQTHAPVTEVSATVETVTTVARTTDDAVDGRSPSVDHGAAAAAMKARAQALVMYRRKLAAPAYDHASGRAVVAAEVCEVSDDGRGVEVATDSVVAASHDGGAGESSPSPPAASPPPRRRVSAVRCSSDGGGPARQPHRTRSASSSGGVGGAGGSGVVGVGGPSPFAVEQLALPRRRPHLSQWTSNTTGGATKDAAQQLLQQRAPPVQLVGPADRRRGAAAAGGVGVGGVATTSTALAASHLPGAAATQDRLQQQQHQQRSRLTRTLSAASASTAHSQQRHRAPSAGAHRGARSPSASRALTTGGSGSDSASTQEQGSDRRGSHPRLRQRSSTPSGGVAVYTTRGASCSGRSPRARGPPASPTHADPASDAPAVMMTRRGVVRSSSAPVSRHATSRAGGTSGSSGAVPVSTPRVAVARVGAPPQVSATPREHVRTASVASVRHHRYQPDTSADTGPVPPPAISSLVQRRSRSRDTGGRSVQRGVVEHSAGVSAAAPLLHTARPVMHAGAGGPRARPVVSTTSAGAPTATATAVTTTTTAAVTRRATARLPRHGGVSGGGGGGHHTISATPASMISMEESKAFLQDFQRLNQRELALFDTLLATVAAEQQQHQRGAGGAAASPAAASPASASFPAGDARHPAAAAAAVAPVSSVDEVSVWTCKRDAAAVASAAVASDDGGARRTGLHRHANGVCALPLPATGESPAALADDEELVVVVRRSRSRSAPSAGPPAGTRPDAGLPSRCVGVDAVAPEPRSPSPAPIPPASVGSTASPNARPPPGHDGTPHVRTTTAAAATRGGLRPRAAADVNAASNVPAASCVRKAPPMSAAAACGARRGANALSRAAGAAVDVAVAERPARQRSVTSYAEMKPSVSPDGAAGRRGGGCRRSHSPESDSHAETGGGAVAACAVTPLSSSSVSPADAAAPPLAALKRVKERAAQQAAAAARVKAAAAAAAAATVSTSASSASVFSCAGSPVRCSPSADRGCTGAGSAVVDVSGVRVTAAQLQLLIDGSRSHANLQRYAPL